LDINIRVNDVGVVFQVVGVFQDILIIIVIRHLDVIGVGRDRLGDFFDFLGQWRRALQPRLLGRLLGTAIRTNRRFFAKVEKPRSAGNACMLLTEFRLGHCTLIIYADRQGRRDAMLWQLCQTSCNMLSGSPMESRVPYPLKASRPGAPLRGPAAIPGDKSISHRALMFGALAVGQTRITGLLEGEDVLRTAAAMRALGAQVERSGADWRVAGRGIGALIPPDDVLDMGNSGTAARLLCGILASHDIFSVMTGDASLRKRPMQRVIAPLQACGARFTARIGDRLPLAIQGARDALPISYRLPVASAQVKSAILLAGLNARGVTEVEEPEATRDHSENMLRHFGATVTVSQHGNTRHIALIGQPELRAADIVVPGDPSSAAFPLVAALLVPGSRVTLEAIGLNPLRIGLFETLREMGAELTIQNPRIQGGEPIGDIIAEYTDLTAIDVPPERAPSMIDEYPILAVACAAARGTSRLRGLAELRVKESDRFSATALMLRAAGVRVEIEADDLIIHGMAAIPGGNQIETHMDHRLAMSALVLGQITGAPVMIDDSSFIDTSFPDFTGLMRGLGAAIASP
jgi:3-phosphoshikimate 1-carboxyvinyltransferase